ncbi:MAG: beta-propeller domain-containing protein [Pseudomonadota bacterium]
MPASFFPATRYPLLTAVLLCLSACGGGGNGGVATPDPPPVIVAPTGLLIPPADDDAFVDAFRRSLAVPSGTATGGEGVAQPAPGLDASGFTTTYRLEPTVDEHDVVKYDGERLFIAPTRGFDCCFFVEPIAADAALPPPPPDPGPRRIRILGTDPGSATASELGAVELDEGDTVEGLYVTGDRLTALMSSAWWGQHGGGFTDIAIWRSEDVSVVLFDVSNPADPRQQWRLDVEGAMVTSRLLGDSLVLVTRHVPDIPDLVYGPRITQSDDAEYQAILDGLRAEDLLPAVSVNGESTAALTAQDCLVTDADNELAPEASGYPVLTTVWRIDTTNPGISDVLCYAEPADGVYVSPNALYIAQTIYDDPQAVDSLVHRIDLADGLSYEGSGRVGGSLTGRGQPDFRMSERDGVLRLVTTRWTGNEDDAFDHRLWTLRLAEDRPELQVLAQLPEEGSETAIGKPNEDLFGVRFVGERAYLVTFERIDPLYVIDLADPGSPAILGELEVRGFSDLLHPVSDELLLGIGDDGEGRVKVELFDVSDPGQPESRSVSILASDAQWGYSEARYDRRAFTYLADVDGTDRFSVPLSASLATESGFVQEERLYQFEVQDKAIAARAQLLEVGVLRITPENYVEARPRAIFDGDAVFFVLGESLWSGFWGQSLDAMGPF